MADRLNFRTSRRTPNPTDLVFVGELRALKGVDVLIEALARLEQTDNTVTATIVGAGADKDAFENAARDLGVTNAFDCRRQTRTIGLLRLATSWWSPRAPNPCPISF